MAPAATIRAMKTPTLLAFTCLLAATGSVALGAEPATRPKDAAEAVQEGNVRNWVEYYERQRRESGQKPVASPPPPASSNPPETPKPPAR
jgi:hypothetical protein